uniref:Uncharacterized protein n=1 Tax=Glossina austeni TaxID=7395 RepID=A0A1A9V7R6_GLOAU
MLNGISSRLSVSFLEEREKDGSFVMAELVAAHTFLLFKRQTALTIRIISVANGTVMTIGLLIFLSKTMFSLYEFNCMVNLLLLSGAIVASLYLNMTATKPTLCLDSTGKPQ